MRVAEQTKMYDSTCSLTLHPNEYSQEFHYYSFAVKLDGCIGSRNTLNVLPYKVRVPN